MLYFVIFFNIIQGHICNANKIDHKHIFPFMRRVNKIKSKFLKQWQFVLVLALGIFCALPTSAQVKGWERLYGDGGQVYDGQAVAQTPDEGFILAGNDGTGFYILKLDPDGNEIWSNSYTGVLTSFTAADIEQRDDGGYIIVGYCDNCGTGGGSRDILVMGIDENGENRRDTTYGLGFDDEANAIYKTSDGGFIITGYSSEDPDNKEIYFLRLDANGDFVYQKSYGTPNDEIGNDIIETDDGYVTTGYSSDNSDNSDLLIFKIDLAGDSLWSANISGGEGNSIAFRTDEDGIPDGFIITGYINTLSNGKDLYIHEIDFSGNQGSTRSIGGPNLQEGKSIANASDGGYIITGPAEASDGQSIVALLLKVDNNLDEEWSKTFGSQSNDIPVTEGFGVNTTADGGYVLTGSWTDNGLVGARFVYIVKTNKEGEIFTNFINGRVYNNTNDEGIQDWIVEAESDGIYHYGTTDENGNYSILVAPGIYNVKLQKPNDYWTPEIGMYSAVNLESPFQTTELDFVVNPSTICTDLEVDVSTTNLVPGTAPFYYVRYCNNGTLEADDAYVDIDMDPFLSVFGSSVSFEIVNGLYRFELGDVDIGECDSFRISTILALSAAPQRTHCVKAHIYPDQICQEVGNWNEASIQLTGECDTSGPEDSVRFNIMNIGVEDLPQGQLDYIVIEDFVMREDQSHPSINSGETYSLAYKAEGTTYRMISEQAEGHPGDSRPTIAIEGCGGLESTGFVTQFAEDDYNHFLAVDCQENFNSFPSNLKRGYPKGYGEEFKISDSTDLSYHLQFQNIGIDTAIRVVIRDTLSPHLDASTVRPGASSHDYDFEVYGCGILKFTFKDNMILPGSSTSEENSHIFVKYRVSQRPDNDPGTLIKNSAAITFDFRVPDWIGNQTCHLVEEDFILVDVDNIFYPGVDNLKVYPNPFTEMATFEIETSENLKDLTFSVYDLSGRQLFQDSFEGKIYEFYRYNLSAGLYIYKIESAGNLVSSGKMTVN